MKPFRYSTISDYHKCKRFYKLKHVDGLDDGSNKSGDMAFGTAIHLAIQDLFEGGDGLEAFELFWAAKRSADLEYSRYGWKDLEALGYDLIAIFRDEHMGKFKHDKLEVKHEKPLGTHQYSGTVDFYGEFKGAKSVVDWKTAAYPYDSYKIKCNEQMYGYAYLIDPDVKQLVYGVAVKDPKNPRWQFKVQPLSQDKLHSVMDNIASVCDTISRDSSFYKNPQACVIGKRICPFFNLCHGDSQDGQSPSNELCNSSPKKS